MSINKKANILVLTDEHSCRHIYRVYSYILFNDKHFILVTDEKQFELLRIVDTNGEVKLITATEEEAQGISISTTIPGSLQRQIVEYRATGLMFTEDISLDDTKAIKFKFPSDDGYINLMKYLPHLVD